MAQHGYESVDGLRAVEVDVVQLPHSLVEESRHSAQVLGAVVGVAVHEDMAHRKGSQAYAVADWCVVDSCQDDHTGLQRVEVRKERLAYLQGRHQQVLHFE